MYLQAILQESDNLDYVYKLYNMSFYFHKNATPKLTQFCNKEDKRRANFVVGEKKEEKYHGKITSMYLNLHLM